VDSRGSGRAETPPKGADARPQSVSRERCRHLAALNCSHE